MGSAAVAYHLGGRILFAIVSTSLHQSDLKEQGARFLSFAKWLHEQFSKSPLPWVFFYTKIARRFILAFYIGRSFE